MTLLLLQLELVIIIGTIFASTLQKRNLVMINSSNCLHIQIMIIESKNPYDLSYRDYHVSGFDFMSWLVDIIITISQIVVSSNIIYEVNVGHVSGFSLTMLSINLITYGIYITLRINSLRELKRMYQTYIHYQLSKRRKN